MTDEQEYRRVRERGDADLPSVTHRMTTPRGEVYVRIGVDEDGTPLEVFVTTGVSGGFLRSLTEAIGITVSKALQHGLTPTEAADGLLGISGGKVAVDNGDNVYSVPDAIGLAIIRTVHNTQGPVRGDATDDPPGDLPAAGTAPPDVEQSEEVAEPTVEDLDPSWKMFDVGDGDAP